MKNTLFYMAEILLLGIAFYSQQVLWDSLVYIFIAILLLISNRNYRKTARFANFFAVLLLSAIATSMSGREASLSSNVLQDKTTISVVNAIIEYTIPFYILLPFFSKTFSGKLQFTSRHSVEFDKKVLIAVKSVAVITYVGSVIFSTPKITTRITIAIIAIAILILVELMQECTKESGDR